MLFNSLLPFSFSIHSFISTNSHLISSAVCKCAWAFLCACSFTAPKGSILFFSSCKLKSQEKFHSTLKNVENFSICAHQFYWGACLPQTHIQTKKSIRKFLGFWFLVDIFFFSRTTLSFGFTDTSMIARKKPPHSKTIPSSSRGLVSDRKSHRTTHRPPNDQPIQVWNLKDSFVCVYCAFCKFIMPSDFVFSSFSCFFFCWVRKWINKKRIPLNFIRWKNKCCDFINCQTINRLSWMIILICNYVLLSHWNWVIIETIIAI